MKFRKQTPAVVLAGAVLVAVAACATQPQTGKKHEVGPASSHPNTMTTSPTLEKGRAFLADNAKTPGVQQTPSGLQYRILAPGTGRTPQATDTVVVHYRGILLNGQEFDSSHKRNSPAEFPLNRVIPGWTEGLQLIQEGGKIELFVPSNLAYGPRGAGGIIGPDETLIFEVELLTVR